MKKTILFALLMSTSSAFALEEWSTTEFPPYVEEVGQYETIDTWRNEQSGIFENQLLEVETLQIDLNGDGDKDVIYLATFGHEGDNVYQQIEIWITCGGDQFQIYQNSDDGAPYNKIVNLSGLPYIRTSYSDTITWINWEELGRTWYQSNMEITGDPEWDISWEDLMQGNR